MKNSFKIIIFLLFVIIAISMQWLFNRGNPNALWQIVRQQCVPNQQKNNDPSPCLKVDLSSGYVLFKDKKGPYHDQVMPADKISGIESAKLQSEEVRPYFYQAWQNRDHLSEELGKPIKDTFLSLAVNSKYGRSQNQLHIHIACLRPEIYSALRGQIDQIDEGWKPLRKDLDGHRYIARKLSGTDLIKEDPFKILQQYVSEQGDNMANYGLALIVSQKGEIILLTSRLKIFNLNFGSVEEIQDDQCMLASN